MTIRWRPRPRDWVSRCLKTWAAARPSFSAVSAVTGSTLAVPRTPSVPKIFFWDLLPFVSIRLLSFSRFNVDVRGPILLQRDVPREPFYYHREGPLWIDHVRQIHIDPDV